MQRGVKCDRGALSTPTSSCGNPSALRMFRARNSTPQRLMPPAAINQNNVDHSSPLRPPQKQKFRANAAGNHRRARLPSAAQEIFSGEENEVGAEVMRLESSWEDYFWVTMAASGCSLLLITGMIAEIQYEPNLLTADLRADFLAISAYALADLGVGIFHWWVDNYGDPETSVVVAEFQGHHRQPNIITMRGTANNLSKVAKPLAYACALLLVLGQFFPGGTFYIFWAIFAGSVGMSQQFHRWSHSNPRDLPQLVMWLQDRNLIVSRETHTKHHRPPYKGNYCIVSGWCNGILDNYLLGFLEEQLSDRFGIRPRWEAVRDGKLE